MAVQIIVAVLLVTGGVFGLVGGWGLVKLPDPMTRLHAPTKAATLGVGATLIASMAYFWGVHGHLSWHELMISLFLFLTAPVTGLFLAKANMHRRWPEGDLPQPPGDDVKWSTYGDTALEQDRHTGSLKQTE
nr:Na+/H+ antiporter subunit G [uncultured Paracoccus sp.]